MSVTGADLIVEARKLLGWPFGHAGRNEHGVDCCGVILLPARALGLSTFEPANYSPVVDHRYLLDCLTACCERLPCLADRQPGDIGAFYIRGHVSHLAYLTGENTLIHAHMKVNAVIEEPFAEMWQKRLASAWRWKGLCECSKPS